MDELLSTFSCMTIVLIFFYMLLKKKPHINECSPNIEFDVKIEEEFPIDEKLKNKAIQILMQVGYKQRHATMAVTSAMIQNPNMTDLRDVVKEASKRMIYL